MADDKPPEIPPETSPALGLVMMLGKLIDNLFDVKTVAVLCATFLGYVFLLPADERKNVGIGDFLHALQGGTWLGVAIGLLLLLALVSSVLGTALWLANRRVQQQGRELAELRNGGDPARLSSQDRKGLAEYGARAKQKHGGKAKP